VVRLTTRIRMPILAMADSHHTSHLQLPWCVATKEFFDRTLLTEARPRILRR